MPTRIPAELGQLIALQDGVIARRQALAAGLAADTVESMVRSGKWTRLQRGTYATFTGEPPRESILWAGLLRCGPGAVLSHETAAELTGLADEPSPLVHVSLPAGRQAGRGQDIPGVVIHRSIRVRRARLPSVLPPRTRVEETVLDLTQTARAFDEAVTWLYRATERGLATPGQILTALDARRKVRWRAGITAALHEIGPAAASAATPDRRMRAPPG
jgi:hypothetical protein